MDITEALGDLPLLEWILYDFVRKFQTWSDCHGGRPEESGLTKDEILNLGVTTIAYWPFK